MSETDTRPYRPSNSTEGDAFESKFCRKCEYEAQARRDETCSGCDTLGMVMAFSIDDEHYPEEWISDADGSNPRCTRFRKEGTGTWEQYHADKARYDAAMAETRAARERGEI